MAPCECWIEVVQYKQSQRLLSQISVFCLLARAVLPLVWSSEQLTCRTLLSHRPRQKSLKTPVQWQYKLKPVERVHVLWFALVCIKKASNHWCTFTQSPYSSTNLLIWHFPWVFSICGFNIFEGNITPQDFKQIINVLNKMSYCTLKIVDSYFSYLKTTLQECTLIYIQVFIIVLVNNDPKGQNKVCM